MTRRLLALLALSLGIVVAVVGFGAWRNRPFRIVAALPNAYGLEVGGALAVNGKLIGEVDRMRVRGRRVLADVRINDRDADLRRSDSVRVRALGGKRHALEIVRGDSAALPIERGDTIHFAPLPVAPRLHRADHDIGRSAIDRVGPDEIATALRGISPTSAGVVFPGSLDDDAQYVFNRRSAPSAVEQHDEWDDILVVQSGHGVIRHAGTWRNGRAKYQGERRGGSLEDPQQIELAAGDVVRIPAGEPHRIEPFGDAPLTYLVVKVRVRGR